MSTLTKYWALIPYVCVELSLGFEEPWGWLMAFADSPCYRVYVLQLLALLLLFEVHKEKERRISMWFAHVRSVPIASCGINPAPLCSGSRAFLRLQQLGKSCRARWGTLKINGWNGFDAARLEMLIAWFASPPRVQICMSQGVHIPRRHMDLKGAWARISRIDRILFLDISIVL